MIVTHRDTRTTINKPAAALAAATALCSLIVAAWAGLGRIGAVANAPSTGLHGPIMVFGFLGTVICVERAVGLRRRWGWGVPIVSALGGLSLLAGLPTAGAILLAAAGAGLTLMYVVSASITGYEPHTMIMGLGAVAWVIAAIGMAAGSPIRHVVPAMAAFLVLTISGERVELSRLGPHGGGRWTTWLLAGAIIMTLAAPMSIYAPEAGPLLAGVGMVVLAIAGGWGDIARRTIRMTRLPRFMAAALLAGYFWLLVGGIAWAFVGLSPGTAGYDIGIHTVFVGFVLSMIFAHAAVIVPAITGIDLPYRSMWWVPLALIFHVGLLVEWRMSAKRPSCLGILGL